MPHPRLSRLSPFLAGADIIDDEGRPLGELHAPAAAREGVEFAIKTSPYSGVRKGRPMNASALVQARGHWAAAVQRLEGWRAARPRTMDRDAGTEALRMWWLTACVLCWPTWQQRWVDAPLSGEAATLHKALQGVATLTWIGVTRDALEDAPEVRSPEDWLALGEETTVLVHGDTGRACAGPPRHILAILGVLMGEGEGVGPAPPAASVPFAEAMAAIEIGRATLAAAMRASGQEPDPGDWTGFLVGQLSVRQAQRLLVHLVDNPLSRPAARATLHALRDGAADPLAELYATAEARLAEAPDGG